MKNERILDALEKVDEELIMEAAPGNKPPKKAKNKAWMKWGAMAACLCLIVGGGIFGITKLLPKEGSSGYMVSEDGITIPAIEVSLSTEVVTMADMIGFFIYEGRCYVYYEHNYEASELVGEYLGTATGTIDEWTPKEGYVDFAGSIRGDFYSVNGYDPEFMLCTKAANGVVTTYICNNGITLKYGKELYEDRLHLSENITGVQYESRMSWYQSIGEKYELDIEEAFIQEFISQLDTEEFLLCRDVAEQEGWEHMADSEIYHMYFMMNNGTKIHLRLHENGYVRFQGLTDLCVKVPADCYDKLLDTFARNKGTPVTDMQEGMETSYEDMLADPQLGKYLPIYIPEEFQLEQAEIYYYLEQKTGKETGTKELYLYYIERDNADRSYTITVSWAEEYGKNGWAGPMVEFADLSLDIIAEYSKMADSTVTSPARYPKTDFGIWYDDVSVVISSRGLEADEVMKIMESAGNK